MPAVGSTDSTLYGEPVLLTVLPNQYRPAGQLAARSVCGGRVWRADS